jgi:amino acid transporter
MAGSRRSAFPLDDDTIDAPGRADEAHHDRGQPTRPDAFDDNALESPPARTPAATAAEAAPLVPATPPDRDSAGVAQALERAQRPDASASDLVTRLTLPRGTGFKLQGKHLEAGEELIEPRGLLGWIWRLLIGAPIPSALEQHERVSKLKALAVFSSDALSSVAYAPEAVMLVLLAAGTAALGWSMPISVVIVVLLAIVATSYRQTIFAYPSGGGSYVVARENLGELAGLIAAASLSVGYILTVSVSISAGVDALISAVQALAPYRIPLALGAIAVVTLLNLRGISESGTIFAIPTYVFVLATYALIVWGLYLFFGGRLVIPPAEQPHAVIPEAFGLFLLLRAFSTGSAVMTGTEAISNSVPAFKPPEPKNAAQTLVAMALILGTMFLGLTFLIVQSGVIPAEHETTISQLARGVFGTGWFYYLIQASTVLILVLAGNTAYASFPRLASLLAQDNYAPHQLMYRGERLAFTNGIVVLGVLAGLLVILFGGDTETLLPLYAVGVFMAFTFSQAGMVVHWYRERGDHWRLKAAINALGAFFTGLVTLTAAVTNFVRFELPIVPGLPFGWWGAWLVLVIVPAFIFLFKKIHQHYDEACIMTRLPDRPEPGRQMQHAIVVPIARLDRPSVRALNYARSLAPNVTAVHVAVDDKHALDLEEKWQVWGQGTPLVVVDSPYRTLTRPLLRFISEVKRAQGADILTVVVPEYIPDSWWEHFLHNQAALLLKLSLLFAPGFVVVSVPCHEEGGGC